MTLTRWIETARRRDGNRFLEELERLERVFAEREDEVLAFVPEDGRFERLRRDAQALLERYPEPAARPPLFGVPVGVKDALHVAGFTTRAGCRLPLDELQGEEGGCVAALRSAGALILGKTVTTEFTYFAPGPTRNPHDPTHTPGGSSSGSAAAVAAGLAPLTVGTQTIGSITRPAAFCGVVGFKATYGRVAGDGYIPLAPTFDHIGLFTADVAGLAVAAPVIVDAWQDTDPGRQPVLGIPEGPYLESASPEGLDHFRQVTARLEEAGFRVERVRALEDFQDVRARHDLIVAAEAARVHESWFPRYRALYQEKTIQLIEGGQAVDDSELERARQGRTSVREALSVLMEEHGIDLWIAPSAPGAAPSGLDWTGDPVMNVPWTHAGLPTVGLPSGPNAAGLPLGLQLAGRWNGDEMLVAWAAGIEEALSVTGM